MIENGDVYSPKHIGKAPLLLSSGEIVKTGDVEGKAPAVAGVEVDVVDAAGCVVTPRFIDPYQHLLGGSGEEGFASQTPDLYDRDS